jgi:hypothetical protein
MVSSIKIEYVMRFCEGYLTLDLTLNNKSICRMKSALFYRMEQRTSKWIATGTYGTVVRCRLRSSFWRIVSRKTDAVCAFCGTLAGSCQRSFAICYLNAQNKKMCLGAKMRGNFF